jgi:hypothetical protein
LHFAGTKTFLEELGFAQGDTLLEKLLDDNRSGGVGFWMTRMRKRSLYREGSMGSYTSRYMS